MKNMLESIPENILKIREKLESGFLGFWVRKYRISYLIALAIVIMGFVALSAIPKESSPNIKFGIVLITTVYPGTNPVDMDSLVTTKLYKEIKDIKGIKKVTTSSSLGVSSINIELQPDVDTPAFISEVRNDIGRVTLPADAKSPSVIEIKSDTNRVYTASLYSPDESVPLEKLRILGQELKDKLALTPSVEKIDYGNTNIYDVRIVFDEQTVRSMGLTLDGIASVVRSYHKDAPIGNFAIGERSYDFRIEGKYDRGSQFLEIPIPLANGKNVRLGDIARVERSYKSKSIERIGFPGVKATQYVNIIVNKNDGANIFNVSKTTKDLIEKELATPAYKGVAVAYSNDLADNINDDYAELAKEAITTTLLVFVCMWLFVGFKDSIFATLTLPLAFFSTFILLKAGGFSLNFLTNFSFILSFGIAVDTIIVIVQAASAKMRVGHDPRSAIMIALKEYSVPITAGVMVTIVAFIPMMVLPGILGKFLAYIPITIFGVLASGLALAMTVNSALYLAFVRRSKTFVHDDTILEYADEDERTLLEYERQGKTEINETTRPLRLRVIHYLTEKYKDLLRSFLENTAMRRISIFLPVLLLVLSFVPLIGGKSLAGYVGFNLFPGSDNAFVSYTVKGAIGERAQSMDRVVPQIIDIVGKYKEVKFYTITTNDVKNSTDAGVTINVNLKKKEERALEWLMDVFQFDTQLLKDFDAIRNQGFEVASKVQEGGPPSAAAVAVKLVADDASKLDLLAATAKDFEREIRTYAGVKNVANSSGETPGQFVFTLKKDTITTLGLTPAQVIGEIVTTMNGVTVGTVPDGGEDLDVVLKYSNFTDTVKPDEVLGHTFKVGGKSYRIGDLVDTNFKNAIASIKREAGLITISVSSDVEEGVNATEVQSKFVDFAKAYKFPSGISYVTGGENAENQDLIVAVLSAFFIAVIAIFGILVLQFNSFAQPFIVLYSVVMALPFVMVGLLLTNNQFSLPFGIGFISFTGIAVNHGIILIDAININLRKGMKSFKALIEAGSSRLEPMILTTLTTALGILPIALRDKFWSGLGFTIIFGLIACTILTLFVVKGLFYEVFMVDHHVGRSIGRILALPFKAAWRFIRGIFARKRKASK